MDSRRMMVFAGIAGLCIFAPLACTDETMTGPGFGDLAFTPSFQNIGSGRTLAMTLTNTGSTELGPVLIGLDAVFRTIMPDSLCSTIGVSITPSSVASLAPGADAAVDVELDTSAVDLVDCPPSQYDADLFAAVGGRVLGGATVRFDWDGTPP